MGIGTKILAHHDGALEVKFSRNGVLVQWDFRSGQIPISRLSRRWHIFALMVSKTAEARLA